MSQPGPRKSVSPRLPPTFVPPAAGATLNYATPGRPRKRWPRRLWNWVRYHVEDRVGNAIMWIFAPLVIFVLVRPFTTLRILLFLFGQRSEQ